MPLLCTRYPNRFLFVFSISVFISCTFFVASTSAFSWQHPICVGCRAAVGVLRFLYERNATATEILNTANFVCRIFAHQDAFVCRGMIGQFQDEFLYVLGQLVFRPSQLCGLMVRDCGTPIDPFDGNWEVPLPPKASPVPENENLHRGARSLAHLRAERVQQQEVVTPLRILQISDIHFDSGYSAGSEADCTQPACCVQQVDHPKRAAGWWGTAAKCDVPLRTVENMLEHISRTQQKLDFVFLSGDYLDHRDWDYTRAKHVTAISDISALLQRHFPDVPVFWTLGNHEGVPVNAFAPHFVPERFRPEWMYRAFLEAGHRTAPGKLPPTVDESAIYRGSYAVDLSPKLKLISLNTGYCETTNMFIYINQTDPDGSLTWLVQQLWEAEKTGQSIYILAHIPPGDEECLESWSRNYYRIIIRFADTIRAQFFGHTHVDSFLMFYANMDNPLSKPVSMLFTAPSVTTFEDVNPAYRIYTADPVTHQLLDYETFFLNLTAIVSTAPPEWELLYTAKSEYGLKDMSAAEWNALIGRIESEPDWARKFNRNYVRRDDVPCDAACLAKRVCAIRAAHHNPKALCAQAKQTK